MKRLLPSALLLAIAASPAFAGDAKIDNVEVAKFSEKSAIPAPPAGTLTMQQAIDVLTGLRNLDGRMVITKGPNNSEGQVMQPWTFENGAVRISIARNEAMLVEIEKSFNDARSAIVKEILSSSGSTEIKPGTPEYSYFDKQLAELLKSPARGTDKLYKIKIGDLKLDKNEIAPTTIAALLPILEQ